MNRATFEELVREAVDDLPEEFAQHLENVVLVVEDEPSPSLLRSLGLNPQRDTLYGLYQGVPLDERDSADGNLLPDTISIYYRPLRRACRTPAALRHEIRATVIHEIAHHFGMDDVEIEDLGY
jgi:predicted Zn-dependent protease with MMP-like domain